MWTRTTFFLGHALARPGEWDREPVAPWHGPHPAQRKGRPVGEDVTHRKPSKPWDCGSRSGRTYPDSRAGFEGLRFIEVDPDALYFRALHLEQLEDPHLDGHPARRAPSAGENAHERETAGVGELFDLEPGLFAESLLDGLHPRLDSAASSIHRGVGHARELVQLGVRVEDGDEARAVAAVERGIANAKDLLARLRHRLLRQPHGLEGVAGSR